MLLEVRFTAIAVSFRHALRRKRCKERKRRAFLLRMRNCIKNEWKYSEIHVLIHVLRFPYSPHTIAFYAVRTSDWHGSVNVECVLVTLTRCVFFCYDKHES